MTAIMEVARRAGLLLMIVAQPCLFASAEMRGSASYFMPHPASIYSGQTYQLQLKQKTLSFTHWQLRAHGGLLANGRIENGAIELTVPDVVPGGRTSASLSLLDAEGGVHQGVLALRVHSIPYYPEVEELPDEVLLLGRSTHRTAAAALLGIDASVDYSVPSVGARLDLAVILDTVPGASLLIEDIVSASPRLADGFLLVVSSQAITAIPGVLSAISGAESVVQQRSYIWSGLASAEAACAGYDEVGLDDGWLSYFRRPVVGEQHAELWGSVLLDFGEYRVLVTRCNIDRAAAMTPEIYDAIVSVWGDHKGKRGEKYEE